MNRQSDREITVSGITFGVWFEDDCGGDAPWDNDCGAIQPRAVHSYGESPDKRAGDSIIYSDRGTFWMVNIPEAIERARSEGWGIDDVQRDILRTFLRREPTPREVTRRAVDLAIEHVAGWLSGEWSYASVKVAPLDDDGEPIEDAADYLGGVETSGNNAIECARDMAQAIAESMQSESAERAEWEARDVVTA